MSVGGLVLAAGGGRRFGMAKALVRWRGRLFVERAVDVLAAGGCTPVLVVIGAASAEVRAQARLDDAVIVENPEWETGMGSSLRVGLEALAGYEVEAAVILPVDTPGITMAAVERVVARAGETALVRATYDGVPGHPVVIGRAHWALVREEATGDQGARDYLRRHPVVAVPCEEVADGLDVDTPADLPAED